MGLLADLLAVWERRASAKYEKPTFPPMINPIVAICIGHSRPINNHPEGGAISVGGVSEWRYNSELAPLISAHLTKHNVRSVIVNQYEGGSYGAAQRWLAARLKSLGVLVAIELHFNAADSIDATGHEVLYWHSSTNGKRLATSIEAEFNLVLPIKARGIKPKDSSDRGAEFLRGTHCPAAIVESFFGSNPSDWAFAKDNAPKIARAIAEGLLDYMD